MADNELARRYDEAIQSFVEKVRTDPNVIAVIVYGSVSHGTVWEKSDIDMMLVVRDQKLVHKSYGIYEDNILINVDLGQRSDLRRWMDKSTTGSVGHSFSSTGKIVYTTDDSLYEYLEEHRQVGQADVDRALFMMANWLIGLMEKVEKWLVVKNDPTYARYYLLKASDVIAQMEVCSHHQIPTREAILQANSLNPELIKKYYYGPMSHEMSESEIYDLLKDMEGYIMTYYDRILSVATEYFGDGEIKTGTQIYSHFKEGMHVLHPILDFLCDRGDLEKLSQTIRLTPKSKPSVEEMAFVMPRM